MKHIKQMGGEGCWWQRWERRQIIMVEGMAYYKTLMWEGASPDMGEIIYTLNTSIILLVKRDNSTPLAELFWGISAL